MITLRSALKRHLATRAARLRPGASWPCCARLASRSSPLANAADVLALEFGEGDAREVSHVFRPARISSKDAVCNPANRTEQRVLVAVVLIFDAMA